MLWMMSRRKPFTLFTMWRSTVGCGVAVPHFTITTAPATTTVKSTPATTDQINTNDNRSITTQTVLICLFAYAHTCESNVRSQQ